MLMISVFIMWCLDGEHWEEFTDIIFVCIRERSTHSNSMFKIKLEAVFLKHKLVGHHASRSLVFFGINSFVIIYIYTHLTYV